MRFLGQLQPPRFAGFGPSGSTAVRHDVRRSDGPSKVEAYRVLATDRADDTRGAIRDNGGIETAVGGIVTDIGSGES